MNPRITTRDVLQMTRIDDETQMLIADLRKQIAQRDQLLDAQRDEIAQLRAELAACQARLKRKGG